MIANQQQNVHNANAASTDLERNIGKIFQRVLEGSSELAQVQTTQWEINQGIATGLQLSLKSMQDGDVSTLVKTLGQMGVQLVCPA